MLELAKTPIRWDVDFQSKEPHNNLDFKHAVNWEAMLAQSTGTLDHCHNTLDLTLRPTFVWWTYGQRTRIIVSK